MIIAILIHVVNSILIFQWAEATKPHPVDNVDITLSDWLNMWGKLCRGAAGISGFPIWVKLLCQLFFDTIDRDHDGVLSEHEFRNFYDVLIEVPQDELDKVTKEGYRAMTAVSSYLLFSILTFEYPGTRFSEPQFSEIYDFMNEPQLPFHILLFIQTRFSEQKGSDNHIH